MKIKKFLHLLTLQLRRLFSHIKSLFFKLPPLYRHHLKTAGLLAIALGLIGQLILGSLAPSANAAVISSTIDTSTDPAATAYSNQRKVDRTQNGVLWTTFWNGTSTTTASMEFWYSTDNGTTWNNPGSSSYFGFANTGASHIPHSSFFIDLNDYAHVAYRDRSDGYIYYRRGTPNASRTSWTWSTATSVVSDPSWDNYPDLIAHQDGTGWAVHIVWGYAYLSTTRGVQYTRLSISDTGTISAPVSNVQIGTRGSGSVQKYPSIDFNHTGDGKTVAGGTPHLYVGWSAGATGAGFGIRFKKATYLVDKWVWGAEREIASDVYAGNNYWVNCLFDGTRVILSGFLDGSTSLVQALWERDAADTVTTERYKQAQALGEGYFGGSVTYDEEGNIYYYGVSLHSGTANLGYRKWNRNSATMGTRTSIDASVPDASTRNIGVSAKRGASNNRVELIYTDGASSPYGIAFWSNHVKDVDLVSPTKNAELYFNQPQTFSWTYQGAGTQSKYAIKRKGGNVTTQTFNHTGAAQTYAVPAGITAVNIEAWGAQGGQGGGSSPAAGGQGGYAAGVLAVTPGENLNVYVGGQGGNGCSSSQTCAAAVGGFNGGGNGAGSFAGGNSGSGAGGGATDIRRGGTALANRVIVAGGGGGSGATHAAGTAGTGGIGGGINGGTGGYSNSSGSPGGGGSQSAGGSAGSAGWSGGAAGSLGQGGNTNSTQNIFGGGAGGGGFYGGGSGGSGDNVTNISGHGGGGGSAYIGGVTNGSTSSGARTGNGTIIISYSLDEWWNASTSQWVTTETWNTSGTASVTFPANSWAVGSYTWSVAVENGSAVKSEYSYERAVTFADPPPSASNILYPSNGSAVNFNSTQRFSWTFNDSGDVQSAYALKRQLAGEQLVEQQAIFTFDYTGSAQQWTVPANVTAVEVEAWGAEGGELYSAGNKEPGYGGYSKGTLGVSPSEILNVYVGGSPTNATGGYNGGGNGSGAHGSAGGGASDVRKSGTALSNRVLVAGGGGGVGAPSFYAVQANGGNGGGVTGVTAESPGGVGSYGAGAGATQSNGGAAGGAGATAGTLGQGGSSGGFDTRNGGAGGGGYYGGGGGGTGGSGATTDAAGGSGGGGSGYIGGVTNGVMQTGIKEGHGQVKITYTYTALAENTPAVNSQITTVTETRATGASNQKRIARTSNGVIWTIPDRYATGQEFTSTQTILTASTNNGETWSYNSAFNHNSGSSIQGSYTGSSSLFIDIDDYAHVVYKDRSNGFTYYRRGTPNSDRTAWTWSASTMLHTISTAYEYSDIVAFREGSGWSVHVVSAWNSQARVYHKRLFIAANGAVTSYAETQINTSGQNPTNPSYPSIDFNHTGDGKTVAGSTPHIYTTWSIYGTGTNFGIRYRKATYSAGNWTWGTEVPIDTSRYVQSSDNWINCVFDGTVINIIAQVTSTTNDFVIYERDVADTTTTVRINEPSSANTFYNGSAAFDSSRNIYIAGRQGAGWGYRMFTRVGAGLVGGNNVVFDTSNISGRWLSMNRYATTSKVEMIYTDGTSSPYAVNYYGVSPSGTPATLALVDTTTSTTSTGHSNQKKIDRTSNGVLWSTSEVLGSPGYIEFHYSLDDGVTWTFASSSNIDIGSQAGSNTPNWSLFIDEDDYAHIAYKDRVQGYIYYRRGTPNVGRTSWTWSLATTIETNSEASFPDLVAHKEGTGWRAHIVYSLISSTFNTASARYGLVTITNAGSISAAATSSIGAYGISPVNHTYPSIDFNHNGAGKIIAGSTPHLYVAWSGGTTGTGYGIRFKKATYSTGAWTWGTEREIDSTQSISSSVWMNCMFDGTRVVIAGYSAQANRFIYDRDTADTTTTQQLKSAATTNAAELHSGSASYDSNGNVYLFGSSYTTIPTDMGFYMWNRSLSSLGARYNIETTAQNNWFYPSAKKGSDPDRLEIIYMAGAGSPYSIRYWGHETRPAPAEQWWNEGTSSWASVEVWNTSVNNYVDFAPSTWALDTNYQWSVATRDAEAKNGPYSEWSQITVPTMDNMLRHGQFFTEGGGDQAYYFRWQGN